MEGCMLLKTASQCRFGAVPQQMRHPGEEIRFRREVSAYRCFKNIRPYFYWAPITAAWFRAYLIHRLLGVVDLHPT